MDKLVSDIPGVGPARERAFLLAGIRTVKDLLNCLPRDYIDLDNPGSLRDAEVGQSVLVMGQVASVGKPVYRGNLSILSCQIRTGDGAVKAVWYNQPYLREKLRPGMAVKLYGRSERDKRGQKYLSSPTFMTGEGLLPVYKAIPGIPAKVLSSTMEKALTIMDGQWPDELPQEMRMRLSLCERNFAMRNAHFPISREALEFARRRLAFEEMLLFQIALRILRGGPSQGTVIPMGDPDEYWKALPFPPTGAQRRVLNEILSDMASGRAMSRLVQGDVGCGKTAVAFGAAQAAISAGWQAALMAPTEILAAQHLESAEKLLGPMGIRCGLLMGGMTASARRHALACISSGEWQLVIGTHALLTESVVYHDLALVITDEQQRFGVRQRAQLLQKGVSPHVLVLSATPIPRTLSMVLYGDLDVSIVDELPPGRTPVKTRVVPEAKREAMYGFMRELMRQGRQIYVVCPLVEESEALDAASAQATFETLRDGPFQDFSVALVHGKMKGEEKDTLLEAFRAGEIACLVSTTVIEVGVNVPNATVMMIENAERFGLSQLHQLRGRVGRGDLESWCFLMAESSERLDTLCRTNDGFVISQKDLELRGPGELFGFRQSGAALSGPAAAMSDTRLIALSHDEVNRLYQKPESQETQALMALAKERYSEKLKDIAMN